jgi:FkbM family methyltransferase
VLFNVRKFKIVKFRIASFYDWATIHQVFINSEYSTDVFSQGEDIQSYYSAPGSAKRKLILDLGANVGISAVFYSLEYPESKIVCVEPASANLPLLELNTRLMSGVEVLHAAVGPSAGTIKLFDPGVGNNAFRTFGSENQVLEEVSVVTVENLVRESPDFDPFLVKIDIEGAEKQLFSSNTNWIDVFKVIVIETHDWMLPGEAISSNLLREIGGKNRDLVFRGENLFSIRID